MQFWVDKAIGCPFIENELVFCQSPSLVTEEVVYLAEVLVDVIVLHSAAFKFVTRPTPGAFNSCRRVAQLDSVSHLGVVVDVLGDEDLSHLKNDEKLHGHELIE